MPVRIQRRRVKGWTKPVGAVNCTRPSKYGNPFSVEKYGLDRSLKLFQQMIDEFTSIKQFSIDAQEDALNSPLFKAFRKSNELSLRDMIKSDLRGKDLMCFCEFDKPCHANILLCIANQPNDQ